MGAGATVAGNFRPAHGGSSTLVRSLLVIRIVETMTTEPVRFVGHRVFVCPVSRFKEVSKVGEKGVLCMSRRVSSADLS